MSISKDTSATHNFSWWDENTHGGNPVLRNKFMRCDMTSLLKNLRSSLGNSKMSNILRKGHETWGRKIRTDVWELTDMQLIILQLTSLPQVCWELKYSRKTFSSISSPSPSASQHYPFKGMSNGEKLRAVGCCRGNKLRGGKGQEMIQDAAGKPAASHVCSHPPGLGSQSWTRWASPATMHLAFTFVLSSPSSSQRHLWPYHPCSLFSHSSSRGPRPRFSEHKSHSMILFYFSHSISIYCVPILFQAPF